MVGAAFNSADSLVNKKDEIVIKEHRALYLDLETTGVSSIKDRIVQIGLLAYDGQVLKHQLDVLINPGVNIPEEVSVIHGITNEMVQDESISTFESIAKDLYEIVKSCDLFVAYNAFFDFSFLQAEFHRFGYELNTSDFIFIDPMVIFKKQMPHSLASAYRFYTGRELVNAHNALFDIVATREVLSEQLARDPAMFINKTWQEISKDTIGEIGILGRWFKNTDEGIFFKQGKYANESIKKAPFHYLCWIANLPDITFDEKRFLDKLTAKLPA